MNSYTSSSLGTYIKKRRWIIDIKTYVLFTMFSAPIIDILNGIFNGVLPVGQVLRTFIIFMNLFIIFKRIPRKQQYATLVLFICIIYLFSHATVTGLINNNIFYDLNFAMKPVLFLSQLLLLENCIVRKIIDKADILKFWRYSCWFVSMSLILMILFDVSTTKTGYYASVNALSMILITNIVFCLFFSQEKARYWLCLVFNLVSIVFLGTKSPYLFLILIFLAFLFFDSKHRLALLVMGVIVGVLAVHLIINFFSEQLNNFLEYHTYHISKAIETKNWLNYLLSGRDNMFLEQWREIKYSKCGAFNLFWGIGRSNFVTGVEMDFFELVFAYGLFIAIFVYSFFVKSFIWKTKEKKDLLFANLSILCAFGFSLLGGHIVLEGIGATYLAILISTKFSMYQEYLGK